MNPVCKNGDFHSLVEGRFQCGVCLGVTCRACTITTSQGFLCEGCFDDLAKEPAARADKESKGTARKGNP